MTALIDINVVLDVLLDRQPWVQDSSAVWNACDEGRITGYLSAITITTIFYVVQRAAGYPQAIAAVDSCLEAFEIAPVYRESLLAARQMTGSDYEDNVQIACAITSFLDCITTRDPGDFAHSVIPVVSPKELMERLARP
jgi:predicted nucleic acid-binding protein